MNSIGTASGLTGPAGGRGGGHRLLARVPQQAIPTPGGFP